MSAIPSSTCAGVFGITRTTATPAGSKDSKNLVSTPATRDTTRVLGRSAGAISVTRSVMS